MSKFVGKFRKNKNYSDDYGYESKKHRNEHAESKKMLKRIVEEDDWEELEYEDFSQSKKV